jgi:hypothetical protein
VEVVKKQILTIKFNGGKSIELDFAGALHVCIYIGRQAALQLSIATFVV